MRGAAAHHPGIGADDDEVEPGAAKNALVGAPVIPILLVQPGLVPIETVRVLHRELAHPDQPTTRAGLVPPLGLDVIDKHRQLAIGIDLLPCQIRDDLLVRHRQDHVALAAILEPRQLWANRIVAARLPPDVGGMNDRHEHLLSADGVHFFPNNLLDLAHNPPSERQQAVDAGPQRSYHRRPQHQPVAGQLDVARRLSQRPAEQM